MIYHLIGFDEIYCLPVFGVIKTTNKLSFSKYKFACKENIMAQGKQNRQNNSSTSATVTGSPAEQKQIKKNNQQIKKAKARSRNLGTVDSMDKASSIVGGMIDALVPQEGEKASIEFNLNIPIHPSGNILLSFRMKGEAQRIKSNKVQLRTEVQLGLLGKLGMDIGLAKLEAHLRVAGLGYIETVGSNGKEAVRFVGLFVRQTIAAKNEAAAEHVMKGRRRDGLFKGMGKGEYAEGGFGVEASTGLGVTNQLHHGRERGGVEAKLRHTQGTRYTSNQGSKNFHAEKTSATEGSFGTSFEPGFGMKGKVRVEQQGANSSVEAEMSGTAELSVSELNTMLLTSTWVSRLVTVFGQVISKGAKVFQGGTGQKVGAFVGMIRNISPGSIVQSHYAAGALKRLKSFGGINIGHKLAIKAKSSNGKLSGEISLERFQSLEFGKDQNDTVHLLLKNIDPVIKMPF